MLLGKVVGNVWASKKEPSLTGLALLLVEQLGKQTQALICADCVGAGEGDLVVVVTGAGARLALGAHLPLDAAIVGIIDHKNEGTLQQAFSLESDR